MLPPFDIEGGWWLAAARACADAGLAAGLGATAFPAWIAPPGLLPATRRRLKTAALAGPAAGLAGLLVWLLAETFDLAGNVAPASLHAALLDTLFGHVIIAQAACLFLALLACRAAPRAAPLLSAAAVLLQAGHSHAEAMDGWSPLLAAAALHDLAACFWLGTLAPLLIAIGREPPDMAASAARRFSAFGMACVATLAFTALWQGTVLLGGFAGIAGTAYGWMAATKACLLALLLALALRNRLTHLPALAADPSTARRHLARNIGLEVALGLAVLLAAGVLTELPPGMHTQPIWPFPWRLSLDTLREDPDFMREALRGAAAMALAVALLATVLVSLAWWRRSPRAWALRAAGVMAAGIVAVRAAPHLDLLFVPAYPTQYFHSPTGFTAASVADGASLFPQNCAACHGADGRGDGPAARSLPVPPANLTAAHLWMHPDGELFWWLAHGIPAPDGTPAMPGFAATLSDTQRWDLIDYIRAHNAGSSVGADGTWSHIVQAPGFEAQCAGGRIRQLADFAGQPVRLVLGAAAPLKELVTITTDAGTAPADGLCVAHDGQVAAAYGVASGLGGQADGAVFLIDADGLLRRVFRPGAAPDPAALQAALADMHTHRAVSALAAGAGMTMDGMNTGGMKMDGMNGMKM